MSAAIPCEFGGMVATSTSRYRAEIGFSDDDVLALGLPDESDLDDALRLANEGLGELAAVAVP